MAMVTLNNDAALATVNSVEVAVGFPSHLANLYSQMAREKMALYRESDLYSTSHESAYAKVTADTNLRALIMSVVRRFKIKLPLKIRRMLMH